MVSPLVSLRSISVRKPGSLILRAVDLELSRGTAVALFGANGSGKTTLLRVVATLIPPSNGDGTVLGARLGTAEVDRARPRIGLVGHEPALYPNLTLAENLQLAASVAAITAMTPTEALDAVGLGRAAERHAARSSNGMRRRLEFARMLMTTPQLLLLDEAHVGLDEEATALVEHIVTETTRRGGCALVASHEAERVLPLVDRSVTLVDGVLTEESS